MPTDACGNYLPETPYLGPYASHSQPLESIRHAGNYFVPLSIRPIFIFFLLQKLSNYLTTDGLKFFSLLPEASLRPVAFATSATSCTDWMCAKSLNTEGSFAVKQISVEPRSRMGWQHDAAQICCWAPEPTDMDPNLQALWCRRWHSGTNALATVAAVNWWDRQTDTWLLH